jgi:hypothetical protein
MQSGEPDRRVHLGGFPQSKAELEGFDTIVLGDVELGRLPPPVVGALRDLVVEEGKSLVLIAGPRTAAWRRYADLAALLPVELAPSASVPMEGPVPIRISLEGEASTFFYAPPGAPSIRRWPELPPMDRLYPPLRKRPAATILLEAAEAVNEYGPLIVAAVHTVGRGQVLYIGTDTLWKWQMRGVADADQNTPYRLFWQQAFRALQPARLRTGTVTLWLQTDKTRSAPGRPVVVRARLEADPPVPGAAVQASVTLPDGRSLPLVLMPQAGDPADRVGAFEAVEQGVYQIRGLVVADGRTVADATATVDVEAPAPEEAPRAPNRAALERLAAGTGGAVLDPADPGTWRPAAEARPARVSRTVVVDPWDGLGLILALVAVLGLDWLIRLMRGYV